MDKALCVQVKDCESYVQLVGYLSKYGKCVNPKDKKELAETRKKIVLGTVLHIHPVVWKRSHEGGEYDCLTLHMKTVLANGEHGVRVRVNFLGDIVNRLREYQITDNFIICIMNPKIMQAPEFTTLAAGPKNTIVWFWKPKIDITATIVDSTTDSPREVISEPRLLRSESNASLFSLARESGIPTQSVLPKPKQVSNADNRYSTNMENNNRSENVETRQSLRKSNKSTGYVSGDGSPRPDLLEPSEPANQRSKQQFCMTNSCCGGTHAQQLNETTQPSRERCVNPLRCDRIALFNAFFQEFFRDSCNCSSNYYNRPPSPPQSTCCLHRFNMSRCPLNVSNYNDSSQNHPVQPKSYTNKTPMSPPPRTPVLQRTTSTPMEDRTEEWVRAVPLVYPPAILDTQRPDSSNFLLDLEETEAIKRSLRVDVSQSTDKDTVVPEPSPVRKKRRLFTVPKGSDIFISSLRSNLSQAGSSIKTFEPQNNLSCSMDPSVVISPVVVAPTVTSATQSEEAAVDPVRVEEEIRDPLRLEEDIADPLRMEEEITDPSRMEEEITNPSRMEEEIADPSRMEEEIPAPGELHEEVDESLKSNSTLDLEKWSEQENSKFGDSSNDSRPCSQNSGVSSLSDSRHNAEANSSKEEESKITNAETFYKTLSPAALKSLNELFSFLDEDYRQKTAKSLKKPNEIFKVHGLLVGILPELKREKSLSIVRGICQEGCKKAVPIEMISLDDFMKITCKHCKLKIHKLCPYCVDEGMKKPLCLVFSFELHLLNGKDVLRVQASGDEAERFLECTAKKYLTEKSSSLKVFKRLNSILVRKFWNKWKSCVILSITVKTGEHNESFVPRVYQSVLSDSMMLKQEKHVFPPNL